MHRSLLYKEIEADTFSQRKQSQPQNDPKEADRIYKADIKRDMKEEMLLLNKKLDNLRISEKKKQIKMLGPGMVVRAINPTREAEPVGSLSSGTAIATW